MRYGGYTHKLRRPWMDTLAAIIGVACYLAGHGLILYGIFTAVYKLFN